MADPISDFDAVVLAGGRGSRLGGVSKADLVLGGERLLDRVLRAAAGVLLAGATDDAAVDGWCLTGQDGHLEWLLGLYRTDALRRARDAYGDCRNRSVRGMLAPLSLAGIDPGAASTDDLDTWADHARWSGPAPADPEPDPEGSPR